MVISSKKGSLDTNIEFDLKLVDVRMGYLHFGNEKGHTNYTMMPQKYEFLTFE